MPSISYSDPFAKLPVDELKESLDEFLLPATERLPERRLMTVMVLLIQGMVASQSPLITPMARGVSHVEETIRRS